MVKIKDLVDQARDRQDVNHDALAVAQHLLRSAVVLGKTATAARATPLKRQYNALFTRLILR